MNMEAICNRTPPKNIFKKAYFLLGQAKEVGILDFLGDKESLDKLLKVGDLKWNKYIS